MSATSRSARRMAGKVARAWARAASRVGATSNLNDTIIWFVLPGLGLSLVMVGATNVGSLCPAPARLWQLVSPGWPSCCPWPGVT